MRLRPAVVEALAGLGVVAAPDDTPERLRERLNERYLEEVRALKQRQQAGEIPLPDYARHVQALKERYAVLGLPLSLWAEAP
ncbi:MAG TPA: hypothetical protein VGN09_29910 [Vicinamibacteria bacterium]